MPVIRELYQPCEVLPDYSGGHELENGYFEYRDNIPDQEHFQRVYDDTWNSLCIAIDRPIQEELLLGLKNDLALVPYNDNPEFHRSRVEQYWVDLESRSVMSYFHYMRDEVERMEMSIDESRLVSEANRGKQKILERKHQKTVGLINQLRSFDFGAQESGYALALLDLYNVQNRALSFPRAQIEQLGAVNRGELTISFSIDRDEFYRNKLEKLLLRVEPYRRVADSLSKKVDEIGSHLFAEDDSVPTLWKAVICMQPRSGSELVGEIRRPLLEAIQQRDTDKARQYLQWILSESPNVLPSTLIQQLD